MRFDIDKSFGMEQGKIEFAGREFTLQNIPLKEYYKLQERNRNEHGLPIPSTLYQEIFDNIVIAPKVGFENFDNDKELEDFMEKVFRFLRREKPTENKVQGQGETPRESQE